MARVLCINDYVQYAEMVAMFLEHRGHHKTKVEIVPFDVRGVLQFHPDAIVLSIVRKMEHVREPITDFYSQVDGAKAFRELSTNPDTSGIPLIISAMAVQEIEIPKDLNYLAFVEIPSKFDNLLMVVDHITKAKGHPIVPE